MTLYRHELGQFFAYSHLPPRLQAASKPFAELAERIMDCVPQNSERTAALRKLLEAKDCAVRATLFDATKIAP
jgi:siroheme synthase (precorrin-2 oxidase/ferrochelatase)